MSFDQFNFSDELNRAIQEQGYKTPTEIQERTIPLALERKDVMGGAQTGTGKTASFMLPILHRVHQEKKGKSSLKPKALILAPTRELASQIYENGLGFAKYLHLRQAVVFGGMPIRSQIMKLKKGVDVLVATPGRLLDHVNQRTIDLSAVEYLVLDEADCMLDMGFIHDIKKVISLVPKERQTLFFSATFSNPIRKLAEELLTEPVTVQVAKNNAASDQVKQVMYRVNKGEKAELLYDLITTNKWGQALVFTRTKHGANRLCDKLKQDGIRTDVIHGGKSQAARTKALANFKGGKAQILVATDIAARGIDIQQLPHVVNYDLPIMASDYVHRIGRTGRAGHVGEAVSLVCVDELILLRYIEELVQKKLEVATFEGYEVDESIKPEPIRRMSKRPFGGKPRQGNGGGRPKFGQSSGKPRSGGQSNGRSKFGQSSGKPGSGGQSNGRSKFGQSSGKPKHGGGKPKFGQNNKPRFSSQKKRGGQSPNRSKAKR